MVSGTGYLGGLMTMGGGGDASTPTATVSPTKPATQPALDQTLVVKGGTLYAMNKCANCHVIDSPGGGMGPNLQHEGTTQPDIDWQIEHLKNPTKVRPKSFMPAYDKLSADELKALAEYLVSHK